ncbi:SRPBCC domain-containing protein [Gordonia sp. (in: high G+C Gram-positive bacteria)]|uniref:SRPBCC domain-containing protein n=1 Tax=Gordonia sp. (in: high G+C Gram-positive bacteria) TaxID=84139 RepID=UPI0039E67066
MSTTTHPEATIEAHPTLPLITITREFDATPEQIIKAHLDPDLYIRWSGPKDLTGRIDYWDARRGGRWAFTHMRGDEEYSFYGSFHEITDDKIVQTFTFTGEPDGVSLETMTVEDLGNGRTRLIAQSLVDSMDSRDAWLRSGMEVGVRDGYAKLDDLLAGDAL